MNRVKHHWDVTLQAESGAVSTEKVAAYWDPEYDGVNDSVGHAAASQAARREGRGFAVIAVATVD